MDCRFYFVYESLTDTDFKYQLLVWLVKFLTQELSNQTPGATDEENMNSHSHIWQECLLCFLTDFGDLSKKLADAWNQLPEGDKQVTV